MILTSQGTPFIHAGQEFGRTKQFLHEDYVNQVAEAPYKTTYLVDENGEPFEFPYFVHDSYDSTDSVNKFDWEKAQNSELYPIHTLTQEYTKGLIHLRRAVDGFRWGTEEEVSENVKLIQSPEIQQSDLAIAYEVTDSQGNRYAVFINTDNQQREFTFPEGFEYIGQGQIIVDALQSGTEVIESPEGIVLESGRLILDPLTATIIRYVEGEEPVEEIPEVPEEPGVPEEPDVTEDTEEAESPDLSEEPSDSESPSLTEEETAEELIVTTDYTVEQSRMTVLPNTGEKIDTRVFTTASLAILMGLGILISPKKKEEEA